ncbi:gp436 family protein [Agitococcus lubricus]|uniref:Phage gp36-like protein n=1 Tax=Agitococcus lubricus TaxID=1077255 RepID=A0A2T5J3S5_9GAMM|nr:DUF1320 domain-containing protein [Agitococcus lubricus]PTQ91269.1 phage gp36-like protein [Agitococcus lubricus]
MYATKQDLINKFGEREVIALTDREPYQHAVNDAVLNDAIAAVCAEIDSYISPRYAVPLNPVPKIVSYMACDMVRYYLTGAAATETDPIAMRYKNAIKYFVEVSKGAVTMGGMPNNAGVAPTVDNTVQMTSGGRVFVRGDY